MALSTIDTFLLKGTGSSSLTYSEIVCIKDYPDIGGTPSSLETTTLCDHQQTFIEGLKSGEQLEFTANYDYTSYSAVVALAGQLQHLRLAFGKSGSGANVKYGIEGHFSFDGYISVRISGKGVDEVREMVIVVTPATAIVAGQETA